MITVYDKDGASYEMTPQEAQAAIASGAYTLDKDAAINVAPSSAMTMENGRVVVFHIETGKRYVLRPVDASEAMKTGGYSYTDPKSAPAKAPANGEGVQEITEASTKTQIMDALKAKGVTFRGNASKDDLYALWLENK